MDVLSKSSNSDNEENDSFHSFNSSAKSWDSLSSSLKSDDGFTDVENMKEHETSQEILEDSACDPDTSIEILQPKALKAFPKPLPDDQGSVSTDADNTTVPEAVCPTIKKAVLKPVSPWTVPKMSQVMPNPAIFNLDSSDLKDHIDSTSDEKEKQQKFAFTEIWVDTQQILPKPKQSPLKDFNNALEDYFNEAEPLKVEDLGCKTPSRASSVDDVFYTPKSTAHDAPTVPQLEEEYVSPLPPTVPTIAVKSPLLKETKKTITLPAGYDLSNLVKYKNPNHWAIRPHVKTGKHYPY
ncbi:uncharacterized protein [Drosophila bipectinata]|uniref:uncharacterized protein n=1 Tax=Drosophila bipectinata TaxID=42026 RepID=UPI001C897135|nr:uncharacterized protein LOC108134185 [Drosophila bipectinata]